MQGSLLRAGVGNVRAPFFPIRRREAAGWTQEQLAERAGIRQETVSRIETGKNAPNVAMVDKPDRALKEAGV